MRRTVTLLGLLAIGVLLLMNPVTGILSREDADPVAISTTSLPATTTTLPVTETTGTTGSQGATTLPPAVTTTAAPTIVTVTGPAAGSEFGDFVVEIDVSDGVLVAVRLVVQPDDRKSIRINDSAFPRYAAQAIERQSADVDVVSGATVTWEALQVTLGGALADAGL